MKKQDFETLKRRLSAEWLTENTAIFKLQNQEELTSEDMEMIFQLKERFKMYWNTWIEPDLNNLIHEIRLHDSAKEEVIEFEEVEYKTSFNAGLNGIEVEHHIASKIGRKMIEAELISINFENLGAQYENKSMATARCILVKKKKSIDYVRETNLPIRIKLED